MWILLQWHSCLFLIFRSTERKFTGLAMNKWQRKKLQNCLVEISSSLNIHSTVLNLRVWNIFDLGDEQIVLNDVICRNDSEKRQKLIEILLTKGENSYWVFCHIIKDKLPKIFSLLHDCMIDGDNSTNCSLCSDEDVSDSNFNVCHKG